MTSKIFLKLIFLLLGVLVLALLAIDQLASRVTSSFYLDTLRTGLQEKGKMIAGSPFMKGLPNDTASFKRLADSAGVRLTLIDHSGKVLADSEGDPSLMENHLDRLEVSDALQGRQNFQIHTSRTIGTDFLYYALPYYDGQALRLGVPLSRIQTEVHNIRIQLLYYTVLAFIPAVLFAAYLARNVAQRLGRIIEYSDQLSKGNFEAVLADSGRDELGSLSAHLIGTGEKLKNMVGALEKEHSELEKLDGVRKDFVINISHELRTPLASIHGYAETLLDGALEDPVHNRRFVEIIRLNAQRLANLTADLLTLSRIELGQKKLQLWNTPVYRLLEDAVDSMRPLAEKKHIALSLASPANSVEAVCDSEAVVQILTNLLDNAIKYTPDGGKIEVGMRPRSDGVEIYVADSGIGVPEEELARLFERFYRVDKGRSRLLGGTGLGLAIVKHLIKAQGGEVWVTSVPGKGSEFQFSLRKQ